MIAAEFSRIGVTGGADRFQRDRRVSSPLENTISVDGVEDLPGEHPRGIQDLGHENADILANVDIDLT